MNFSRKKIVSAMLSSMAMSAGVAHGALEEIVVTATKRSASTQDIPVAVSAMGEESLDQLGVTNFSDYLVQMPGVSAGGAGPGQNTIYIRGVASTTPNLTVAGVAGLAPNVALYLDEQPLAQPGRNLDVYAADLQRVEVLAGPQGTLFGASSQAGTVRLITNKPDPAEFYGNIKAGFGYMQEGDESNNIEVVLNVPVTDRFAVRGVAYRDNQGGYIDNVHGTLDLSESARFREAGTVRANGVPVSLQRAGVQSASFLANTNDPSVGARVPDLSNVTFLQADNANLVEDDFNETTYTGGRIVALWDFSDDWSLQVGHMQQDLEADGVFFVDPELSDLEIQRYEEDKLEDTFDNTNWTIEGRIGELELLYTGAFTDRETEQTVDYADYLFVGQYLPYYQCDSTVTYPEYNNYYVLPAGVPADNVPVGTCYAPNMFVDIVSKTEVKTHEFRVNTDPGASIRATLGAFYRELELRERNDYYYLATEAITFGSQGFSDNFPFTTGYRSDPGPFPEGVAFRNDVLRTDEQLGLFGEVTFDLTDTLSATVGARYYDTEVDMEGGANAVFCNSYQPDIDAFGTDISDLYNGDGEYTFRTDCTAATHITFQRGQTFDEIQAALEAVDPYSIGRGQFTNAPNAISPAEIQQIVNALDAPDTAQTDGYIAKLTLTWTPDADQLYYATVSEGFRPGLLNRPGGAPGPDGFTVPFALDTDDVMNFEFGWKTDLLDGDLRFNGNLFFIEIENLQTTIFDPSISNLFFSDNAADAEVLGIEGDVTWGPSSIPGLTVNAAFSILDTEITDVLTPTDDVRAGDELAFAPGYQGTLRARYEWSLGSGLIAHVMPNVALSDKSYSDIIVINRDEVDSWVMWGLTAGVSTESWSAEFYADNLSDERAEISRSFIFDRQRVSLARPRTMGLRVSYHF